MKYEIFGKYPVTYIASFDPTQKKSWKLTSWNGNPPEKYQEKSLDDRVEKLASAPVIVDETTLKSAEEGGCLVVSFRIKGETAPKEYMYLKDCDGKSYINTSSGKLEKTVWDNFQPTKNGAVRIKKIHEVVEFGFADGVYHTSKEAQSEGGSITTKEAGEISGEANQTVTYTNYRKVK
jgi:hypothetical protein